MRLTLPFLFTACGGPADTTDAPGAGADEATATGAWDGSCSGTINYSTYSTYSGGTYTDATDVTIQVGMDLDDQGGTITGDGEFEGYQTFAVIGTRAGADVSLESAIEDSGNSGVFDFDYEGTIEEDSMDGVLTMYANGTYSYTPTDLDCTLDR